MQQTLRQKAFAAGLDPAYWYAVEWDRSLRPGTVREVEFQGTSVALYRDAEGELHAVENRCAHRQVKLSHGQVRGCELACAYHGWTYGPDGRLTSIPHELFGRPSVRLKTYPVAVRYGLVWIFFGDPALAAARSIPEIPEHGEWMCAAIDFVWRAHPTAIVNNVMDSTHVATLHARRRITRSFVYGPVTRCEVEAERVLVSHTIERDPLALLGSFTKELKVRSQDACYEYPHLWVSVGGVYKLWNFMLPSGGDTTRIFILAYAERIKVPFTAWLAPRWMSNPLVWVAKHTMVRTLFGEDGWSTAIEQEGFVAHGQAPSVDPHPAIRPSYQLTVRKWEEHLAQAENRASRGLVSASAPTSLP